MPPIAFPDASKARQFFRPDKNGSVSLIDEDDLEIEITGLKPLPDGSEYFLMLEPTPVGVVPDSKDRG